MPNKKTIQLTLVLTLLSLTQFSCNGSAPTKSNSVGQKTTVTPAQVHKMTVSEKIIPAKKLEQSSIQQKTTSANNGLNKETLFQLLVGEFLGNAGDYQQALGYYEKASKEIPDSRVAARTAYIALYAKDYPKTLSALKRWQALAPNSPDIARTYATTYLKTEQPKLAVHYIQQIFTKSSISAKDEALVIKEFLANEASIENAYLVLEELNRVKTPKNTHLMVLQSRYAAQLKNYDKAIQLLDDTLKVDPSLHNVQIIKSRILMMQGKKQQASTLIKDILKKHPNDYKLRLQYARMLVELKNIKVAIKQFKILQKNYPEDADVNISLGLLYIEDKKLDKAEKTLLRLIKANKKVPIANYYLGRLAQNKDKDEQALKYYRKVLYGDYFFESQLRIAVLQANQGQVDNSLRKLDALAESQQDWNLRVKVYLTEGEVLVKAKRYKDGVEMYSRALQQKPDDTTLLYARGLMAEKVDRLDITEADLLKVIAQEPKNADALNALGFTLADRTSRYVEAKAYISRAAKLVPDDPAILDSLGWVSYRLGQLDEAEKWLSKAFKKLVDAEIAAHYGEVLWKLNRKQQAREVWKKGQAQNKDNPVLLETLKRINP